MLITKVCGACIANICYSYFFHFAFREGRKILLGLVSRSHSRLSGQGRLTELVLFTALIRAQASCCQVMLNFRSALTLLLWLLLQATAYKDYIAMPLLMLLVMAFVSVAAMIVVPQSLRILGYFSCRSVWVGNHSTCNVKLR